MTQYEFGKWYPIESAEKVPDEILGWREDAGVFLMRWDAPENFLSDDDLEKIGEEAAGQYDWFYADSYGNFGRLEGAEAPTHWMPLPPAPTDAKEE